MRKKNIIIEFILLLAHGAFPWTGTDVGSPTISGNHTREEGVITITAAGKDIWGTSDQCYFLHFFQDITDSDKLTITARIHKLENTDAWAKAGIMLRQGNLANASNIFLCASFSNGIRLQRRASDGASTSTEATANQDFPIWLRMECDRSGLNIICTNSYSFDGQEWTGIGATSFSHSDYRFFDAGLAVTSHDAGNSTNAIFSNVELHKTASAIVFDRNCCEIWGSGENWIKIYSVGDWDHPRAELELGETNGVFFGLVSSTLKKAWLENGTKVRVGRRLQWDSRHNSSRSVIQSIEPEM